MRKLVPLLVSSAVAVDRGNFKTCKDSSFCERQRRFDAQEQKYKGPASKNTTSSYLSSWHLYSVVFEPVSVTSHSLEDNTLKLRLEVEGRPCLAAEHSILAADSGRVVIEECEPLHKRYQVCLST